MKIAYLMNQHPYLSCTFIRREIRALEKLGIDVARFSIRHPEIELVDDADKEEFKKTRFILGVGPLGLILSTLSVAVTRPRRFTGAMRLLLKLVWTSAQVVRRLAYLAEACVLLRWLSTENVALVHAHFGSNSTTVAMLCNALGGPPYSFTVHGPREFTEPLQIALPEKIRRAAMVVAISSFARSQLFWWSEYEHWPKIHEIHCCVDNCFLNLPRRPIAKQLRFVCVGRLSEHKGQLLLVEAAARLATEGFRFKLVFVGDGPLRNTIESQSARLGLEETIEITGWASGTEVREQMLASRVMVLPSFAEGLPVVIMEALVLGRPVISTYVAGIPELVIPGVCGWLVTAGCIDSLTNSMREALQTPSDRLEAMGAAGAARVHERHNLAIEAPKLKQLFKDVTQERIP